MKASWKDGVAGVPSASRIGATTVDPVTGESPTLAADARHRGVYRRHRARTFCALPQHGVQRKKDNL